MPGFREWLRQFERDETAIGDLARDAAGDHEWPRGPSSLDAVMRHLADCGANDAAFEALGRAWEKWHATQRPARRM
jgi:YozE SAM-like fold